VVRDGVGFGGEKLRKLEVISWVVVAVSVVTFWRKWYLFYRLKKVVEQATGS
jgi:hypothetical protein